MKEFFHLLSGHNEHKRNVLDIAGRASSKAQMRICRLLAGIGPSYSSPVDCIFHQFKQLEAFDLSIIQAWLLVADE